MGKEARKKATHTPGLVPQQFVFPYEWPPFVCGSVPLPEQITPFCDGGAGLSMRSIGLIAAVLKPAN